ncbi:DUF4129 domain-containing protein [Streptomyces sp. NPDC050529]|uniref:DUF4129 domain-containing protein n=1 Tax=unclassified Streptomyces TaxID=2593676 RepID=UPI002DD93402|nr:DUF4129 domain-containing protein [Streptomyces sp. NBC_01022]WRZ82107.1 DUF4129 domain-containing protein [Streptomyces sp. NBC_01022]
MSGAGGTTAAAAELLIRASGDIPVDIPRVPAREAARHELSKPMYHENDPNPLQRALDHLWGWIGDLLSSASGAAPGGPAGLVVLVLIVIALAAALLWRLGTPQRSLRAADALFESGPSSAPEHRATAEAHAAAGRWIQAVQERMRAIVRSLEERALLDARPGRTADEAAEEAGLTLPAHASRLLAAAQAFDDVTYGGRPADRQAYLTVLALDLDLECATPQFSGTLPGAAE